MKSYFSIYATEELNKKNVEHLVKGGYLDVGQVEGWWLGFMKAGP